MYVAIEMADIELIGVNLFKKREDAIGYFEKVSEENGVTQWTESEMAREAEGTIAIAGDDAYSVQVVQAEAV